MARRDAQAPWRCIAMVRAMNRRCLNYSMVGHRVCHHHYQAIVRSFHREKKETR